MGVGILRLYVLSQVIEWCNAAIFAKIHNSLHNLSVHVCISLTFHIKLDIIVHNSFSTNYEQSHLCNEMCGLPLTINGSYKSPIYLSWAKLTTNAEHQLSLSRQGATFKLSCPVILINSVYLSAVIIENGPYNFSRQRLRVEKLTSFLSSQGLSVSLSREIILFKRYQLYLSSCFPSL